MNTDNFSDMPDHELLHEAKKIRSSAITNALFIGFLIGIILFSVFKNKWGIVTLIPLYLVYKLAKTPKNDKSKALEEQLQKRNLK